MQEAYKILDSMEDKISDYIEPEVEHIPDLN